MIEQNKEKRIQAKRALYWCGVGEIDQTVKDFFDQTQRAVDYIVESASIEECDDADDIEVIVVDLLGAETSASSKLLSLYSSASKFSSAGIILLGHVAEDRLSSLHKKYSKLVVFASPPSLKTFQSIPWLSVVSESEENFAQGADKSVLSILRLESLYGGGSFSLGNSKSHFKIPSITSFPKLVTVFERIWKLSPKSALKGQRVAHSATTLAKGIGLSEKKQTDLAQAAFFLHGLSGEKQEEDSILEYDFFLLHESKKLSELSDIYKSTSVIVEEELGLPDAARYIRELSEHFSLASKSAEPGPVSDSVGCLLVPELAERSIWKQGRWDRYGLSRLVRNVVDGKIFSFSTGIVSLFGKMLVEAFGLRLLLHPEPVKLYERKLPFSDELVDEEEERAEELIDGRDSEELLIEDLKTGMTVLAPIVTADGVMVLRSNIVLDDYVIDCLNKLHAVRPLERPILVEQV